MTATWAEALRSGGVDAALKRRSSTVTEKPVNGIRAELAAKGSVEEPGFSRALRIAIKVGL